jgi:ribonuclease D
MTSSAPLISTATALEDLAAALDPGAPLGLDTEFLRERTYRAELCLLQVTTPRGPACIDPLALPGLQALQAVLTRSPGPKVLHAARQDLEVLAPVTGVPAPVFDTQVAAALAGFPAQVGYAELVRRLLGHELSKAHTRTDWSRRPLSTEQIDYALDDVRYLLPLREQLLEAIERLGRSAWLAEELAALADPAWLVVDPERAWQRIKGLQSLDAGRAALARALAAWRERRAMARNRPRGWILDDAVLREIIQRVPRGRAELAALPGMPEGVVRHSGDELLSIIEAAPLANPPPPLPRAERPDPAFTALVKKLGALTQAVATDLQLATEVLATRRELEQVARGEPDAVVMRGWRREVIGTRLAAAV